MFYLLYQMRALRAVGHKQNFQEVNLNFKLLGACHCHLHVVIESGNSAVDGAD